MNGRRRTVRQGTCIARLFLIVLALTGGRAAEETPDPIIGRMQTASEQAMAANPGFADLTSEARSLIELQTGPRGYAARSAEERRQLDSLRDERDRLARNFEALRQRVESVRVASAAGHVLRTAAVTLPALWERRRSVWRRDRSIADEEYRRLDLQDREARLRHELSEEIERIIAGLRIPAPEDAARQRVVARDLLTAKRDLLSVLLADSERRLELLVESDAVEREIITLAQDLRAYVNERVLWLPTQPPLAPENAVAAVEGLRRLLAPTLWVQSGSALRGVVEERPVPVIALLALVLVIAGARPVWRRRLRAAVDGAEASGGVAPIGDAVVHTLLTAALLPFAAYAAGWILSRAPGAPTLTRSMGLALPLAIPILVEIEIWRALLLPGGVAVGIAGWNPKATQLLAVVFRRLSRVFVPLVLLALILRVHSEEFRQVWSGRAHPVVGLLALGALGYAVSRLMKRGRAGESPAELGAPFKWPRFRRFFAISTVGIGVGAGALIALGYSHTAVEVLRRILDSATVVLGGFLIWSFVHRKLLLPSGPQETRAERLTSIARIRGLAVLIVVVGLGFVWAPVFPAVRYLNTIQLWHVTTGAGVEAVTVASLLGAIAILVGTVVLARFVPGSIEALAPAARDTGARYAISTVSQYVVVVVGVLAGLASIKVDWSQLQWLAAGFSVGIGFGLQEIVANFVSGLILLFERPVRVGDTVTVGQTTGTVSRINVRATTIVDVDRKQLIVPNRDLITQQVQNWTLDDSVVRLTLEVGVAYGSDVDLVERLLLEAAQRSSGVLADPAPRVLFNRFADSALDFRLYIFVDQIDQLITTRHAVQREIDRAFRAGGVTVPFPQRELHLDTAQPLPVRVVGEDPAE